MVHLIRRASLPTGRNPPLKHPYIPGPSGDGPSRMGAHGGTHDRFASSNAPHNPQPPVSPLFFFNHYPSR